MKKMIIKLTAASLSLVLAVTVAVMSSYAWLTLSDSPTVNGIYVAVGGGNTILVAPNLTASWDGQTYDVPGTFSDSLIFNQYENYKYLSELGGLNPVSTADGINWLLPEYYQRDDAAVIQGQAQNGELKPFSQFTLDDELNHANLASTDADLIEEGSYVYLDFWVVSPGADYRLRVSTGDETDEGGSFVIGLMDPQETDADADGQPESYRLVQVSDTAAASARVGFLVNESQLMDNSMMAYMTSGAYSDRYEKLKGSYGYGYEDHSRFTIYEPNGTLHPGGAAENGSYVITRPLSYSGQGVHEADISAVLTVQEGCSWSASQTGTDTMIEQVFQGTVKARSFRSSTLAQIKAEFYSGYLQGQVGTYVNKGRFFKNTANLYAYANTGNTTAQDLEQAHLDENSTLYAGATDDVYIVDLERNVPQRIRMFIWLEGQDIDCTQAVDGSAIAVSIELAGSNNGV